jgi:hypothetical protein
MESPPRASRAAALATLALCLGVAGCGSSSSFAPDQPPTLTLTSGPVDTASSPQSWLVTIAWTASDPDGRIDHFEYALDPPSLKTARMALAETSWVRTTATSVTARFRAAHADSLGLGATASDFHVFVLRAFDNRGGISPLLVRAFYARTVAPDVQIVRPLSSPLLPTQVPSPFRIEWHGHDPDGEGVGNPTAYRIRVLNLGDPGTRAFLVDPDSLLHLGQATNWQDWSTVGGDTTSLALTASTGAYAGSHILVAVLAVDQAGATTPYLLQDRNFFQYDVTLNEFSGAPRIHISSSFVDFTYDSGGYSFDPLRFIPVEVPTHLPLEFCFDAIAAPGRVTSGSRWMLDGSVGDETPRSGPSDLSHWSKLLSPAGCIELPGLDAGEHSLYVEVSDDFGDKSLAIVTITAVDVALNRDLLVVDDTRLEADKFISGRLAMYTTVWPSAAELDTFLYARGGVPWRLAQADPTATSVPGLLAGYAFDTLGTRLGLENPANAVRLARLGRYRHVLWFVDQRSAQGAFPLPGTALEAMSAPGVPSSLAAYVAAGGDVWLAGGGAALATLKHFNQTQNDTCGTLFTATAGELALGRIMYDAAHVRSALAVGLSGAEPQRSPAARGGWSGGGPSGTLTAPDYSRLPVALRFRSPATDPLPPTRSAGQAGLFYASNTADEYVSAPNEVTEPVDPHVDPPLLQSTLDTLYDISSSQLCVSPAPAMLYYHGRDNAPFVFTGFDLWSWSRSDAQGLVDFVLGDIWGMARSGPRAAGRASVLGPGGARRPAVRGAASHRLDPPRVRP